MQCKTVVRVRVLEKRVPLCGRDGRVWHDSQRLECRIRALSELVGRDGRRPTARKGFDQRQPKRFVLAKSDIVSIVHGFAYLLWRALAKLADDGPGHLRAAPKLRHALLQRRRYRLCVQRFAQRIALKADRIARQPAEL